MSDTKPPVEPPTGSMEALLDIQTLARVALQSSNFTVMQRDLEIILTIAEMVLPQRQE